MRTKLTTALTLATLASTGCPVGAPLVDGAKITCAQDSDCQPGEICDLTYDLCIASPDAGSPDAGPTVCVINGQTFDAGTLNPTSPCQSCQPGTSTTVFSPLSGFSSACPSGDVCNNGSCTPGCYFPGSDPAFVPANAINAGNPCQVCEPGNVTSGTGAWDLLNGVPSDAGTCPGGNVCVAGSCASGCLIDGGAVAPGSYEPDAVCQWCDPSTNATGWSPATGVPPTGDCDAQQVCHQGACATGCVIDGGFVPDGGLDVTGGCRSCNPGIALGGWSSLADDTVCAGGGFCQGGVCESGCLVSGTFYLPDGGEQGNVCAVCDPTGVGGTSAFSPVSGTVGCSFGGGDYCSKMTAGSCVQACVVDGGSFDPTQPNPANDCQSCEPATSSSSFSNDVDGTTCSMAGNYCKAGACGVYCDIGGALVPDGGLDTIDPNPNKCCNVGLATQAWTAGFGTAITTPTLTGDPVAIAIGDVTGDGIPDIIVGESIPLQIEVLKGSGDGGFTLLSPPLPAPTGAAPLVLADFNNDGFLDVAVANNGGNSVTILLNQGGDGGFASSTVSGIFKKPTALLVADLQDAGSHDLVVAAENASLAPEVVTLLNSGGTFSLGSLATVTGGAASLAAGNFNGLSGEVDVAALGPHDVTVVTITTAGTTVTAGVVTPITANNPVAIAAANLDGHASGLSDLVIADSQGNQLIPLLNGGSSVFTAQAPTLSIASPSALVTADFNGDGKPDVAATDGNGNVDVFINQTVPGATTSSFFIPAGTYAVVAGAVVVGTADVNRDSLPDLVTASGANENASVLLGQCP